MSVRSFTTGRRLWLPGVAFAERLFVSVSCDVWRRNTSWTSIDCVSFLASLPEIGPVNHKSRGKKPLPTIGAVNEHRLRHYTSTPVAGCVVLGLPVCDEAKFIDSVSDAAGKPTRRLTNDILYSSIQFGIRQVIQITICWQMLQIRHQIRRQDGLSGTRNNAFACSPLG